uniref:Heat shock protein 70-like n=1 Tax=Mint virus 1 TaxID=300740 RepID=Q52V37_9CLOS|nr:heat shock protein 70-like [Mint virus 1]
MVVFGLDFGTTFSTLSVLKANEVFVLKQNDSPYIPTYLFFYKNSREVAYGYDAERLLHSKGSEGGFFRDLKRWIGCTERNYASYLEKLAPSYTTSIDSSIDNCDFKIPMLNCFNSSCDMKLSLPDLVASFVRCIVTDGENSFSVKCSGVVCSVPAAFTSTQRNFIMECVSLSGFHCSHIINEPSAAAFSAFRKLSPSERFVMVYDFGGGTFDVSAVSVRNSTFVVKASGGDMNLGGRDVDRALLESIHEKAGVKHVDYTVDISSIKEKVSQALSSFVYDLPVGKEFVSVLVTVEDVSKVVVPFIERTVKIMHSVYKSFIESSLDVSTMNHDRKCSVVTVGGSSYLPGLKNVIEAIPFVDRVVEVPDARSAVSAGCALYSLCLSSNSSMLLVDCATNTLTTPSYTCETIVVVPKGAPIPFSGKRKIFLSKATRSKKFYAALFEGEYQKCALNELVYSHNVPLSDLGVTSDIPRSLPMTLEVQISSVGTVKFDIVTDGGRRYTVGKDRPYDFSSRSAPSRNVVRMSDSLQRRTSSILYSSRSERVRSSIREDVRLKLYSPESELAPNDVVVQCGLNDEEKSDCAKYLDSSVGKIVRGASILKLDLD